MQLLLTGSVNKIIDKKAERFIIAAFFEASLVVPATRSSASLTTGVTMRNSGSLRKRTGELSKRGNTGRLISAHYLELEYLLDHIEQANNYYQALGVERSASNEAIIAAYHQAVAVLHPPYHKVRASVTDETLARVDRAFQRVSESFTVLTHVQKRSEYDQSLARTARAPLPIDIPTPQRLKERKSGALKAAPKKAPAVEHKRASSATAPSSQAQASGQAADAIEIVEGAKQQPAFTVTAEEAAANRRRCDRFRLMIPTLVAGCDRATGKWQEMTKTVDANRLGIAVQMQRRVLPGMVLHITLPMPPKLRVRNYSDPAYSAYAIVRRVELPKDNLRLVGLEFLGEHPPSLYLYKPWAIFQTQKWTGINRRHEARVELTEMVKVEYFNDTMNLIGEETGFTENVSSGGARIYVKAAPFDCDIVRIISARRQFDSRALIRNRFLGKDGLERLCLQFLDAKWPV